MSGNENDLANRAIVDEVRARVVPAVFGDLDGVRALVTGDAAYTKDTTDFYAKYLQNPENARRGVWDIAIAGWFPDWYGNNGRTVLEALFDGRTIGPNSQNFGGYDNPEVNRLMDQPMTAAAPAVWKQIAANM